VVRPAGALHGWAADPAQIAAGRAIVASSNGVLRRGDDYRPPSLPDSMHFELVAGPSEVAAFAARIHAGQVGATNTRDWFDMATDEDLGAIVNAAIDAKLGRNSWGTTGTLPNRRGPGGSELKGGGAGSWWGYLINADGFGYPIEQLLTQVAARVGTGTPLSSPPPTGPLSQTRWPTFYPPDSRSDRTTQTHR
jgi:hypothetical protein